jgi:hypothetical protein
MLKWELYWLLGWQQSGFGSGLECCAAAALGLDHTTSQPGKEAVHRLLISGAGAKAAAGDVRDHVWAMLLSGDVQPSNRWLRRHVKIVCSSRRVVAVI